VCLTVVLGAGTLLAQFTGDVIGSHDLGPGSKSPITGALDPAGGSTTF